MRVRRNSKEFAFFYKTETHFVNLVSPWLTPHTLARNSEVGLVIRLDSYFQDRACAGLGHRKAKTAFFDVLVNFGNMA
jgi:hypothetical protein